MAMFSFPMFFGMKMFSSNCPMKVLTLILLIVWILSVMIMETGEIYWVPIFSIMLFNGGLMILFLFVVSMIPKKKEEEPSYFSIFFIFIVFFLGFEKGMVSKMMENFYFQGIFLVLMSSILMIFYFLGISKLSADPFKSLKSF